MIVERSKMSDPRGNPCDIGKLDPEPVKSSIEKNLNVNTDSSINTPKQTDNTPNFPSTKATSHDNMEATSDEGPDATNKPLIPDNEPKEGAKGKSSAPWAMPSPVNKVTPQAPPNTKAVDSKGNEIPLLYQECSASF